MPKSTNPLRMALRALTRFAAVFSFTCAILVSAVPQSRAADTSVNGSTINFSELAEKEKNSPPPKKKKPEYKKRQTMPRNLPVTEQDGSTLDIRRATSQDSLLSTRAADAFLAQPSPQPSASFQALDDNGTVAPPDTSGAAGPNHLVVALASEIRIQTKTGTSLSRLSTEAFWAGVSSNVFDPRVIYDPYGQRFVMTGTGDAGGSNPRLLVAVSQTTDPTGAWYRFSDVTDSVNPVYPDSPQLGFNNKWIVVQANMFNENTFAFFRSEVFVYDKASLYSGVRARTKLAFDSSMAGSQVPAMMYDPTNAFVYLVKDWNGYATNAQGQGFGYLRVFSISGAVGSERLNVTNSSGNPVFVVTSDPWESYSQSDRDMLPQLGTTNKIYAGDSRIQSLAFREGLLWCTHTIFLPTNAPTRASVQWWALTVGGNIIQNGRIDDPGGTLHYAYPSMSVNRDLDVLIGYSRFSASQYPSANYSFRQNSDPFNSLRDEIIYRPGQTNYYSTIGGVNRWGDWSATMVDPSGDTDFWTLQQYAEYPIDFLDRWGTWWARVSPPNDLAIGMSDSPDPVVSGATLSLSLQVTNNLDQKVSGGNVQVNLSPGVSFSSATSTRGTCTYSSGVVNCALGQLSPLGIETITISLIANTAGSISNVAIVSANGPDINVADNTAIASTTVLPSADLSVQCIETPDPVTVGSNLTYSITVSNRGPYSASSVFVTNTLPASFGVAAVNTSQGTWGISGNVLTFTIGSMVSGGSVAITINGTPNTAGNVTNRTQIASSTTDLNTANNTVNTATRVNARPSITSIATQNVNEDSTTAIAFTISDAETAAASLQLTITSSNPGLIPTSGLVVSGTGQSRTLSMTPALNQFGSNVTITIKVTDADGASASSSFTANVAAVNDAPTISVINDTSIDEDTLAGPLSFTVGDVETPAASLTLSAASSDTSTVPVSNITFGGSGASRTVSILPATNQNGTVTITVTVSDGAAIASRNFVLTINAINDPPVISTIPDQSTDEDTPSAPIVFQVGDIENSATNLTVTATSSNTSLVPNANLNLTGQNTNRTLVATPAANQSGTAVITVTVTDRKGDSGSTAFTLTVNPVNDPPKLDAIADITANEDAGRLSVNLTGIGSGAANESQTLVITATTGNPSLVTNLSVTYTSPAAAGTLTFDTVQDAFGSGDITVTVDDGQSTNRFFSRTFTVTLNAVNDAPTLDPISSFTIPEDAGEQVITLTGVGPGAGNEINQTVIVTANSSAPGVIPDPAVSYTSPATTGTLRFTPVANAFGTSTITVVASDGRAVNPTITRTFVVTVQSVNDAPIVSAIADRRINEDASTGSIPFTMRDVESAVSTLTLSGVSSNPTLVPNTNIVFGGSGTNRNVNVTPAANEFGVATISVLVSDPDGATTTNSFVLTVDSVNDLPTLNAIADPAVIDEDSGEQTINLSGISAGAPNELGQALNVVATSSNPSLIPNLSVSYTSPSATGTLRYTPPPNTYGTGTVTVTVFDNGSTTNNSTSRLFTVRIRSINDVPSISAFPEEVTTDEDLAITLPFTIDDVETAAASLVLTGSSSNPEAVDNSGITFGGSGKNRTVTIRPLTNEFGVAPISITVRDADGATATSDFVLIINEINDRPVISPIAAQTIQEDASTAAIPFTVGDEETPATQLAVSGLSSDTSIVPNSGIFFGGSGTNRTVRVAPAADQFGVVTISVTVNDGAQTNTSSFALTINSVNDQPKFDPLSDLVLQEDAPEQVINLTGVSPGAANETSDPLTIIATSSNRGLIPDPQVTYTAPNATGTLRFTPIANASGSATITVTANDGRAQNSTLTRTFQVTVQAVNDPPVFLSSFPDKTIFEDAATNIAVRVADVETPAANLTLTAASSNPSLVPNANLVLSGSGTNRNLAITPLAEAVGTTVITLGLRDTDGGSNSVSFTLTVLDINDPPTLNAIADLVIDEDSVAQVINLSGISSGAPNENQTLLVTAASSNPGLTGPLSINYSSPSTTGSLSFRAPANSNGTARITVTVDDQGSTNSTFSRAFNVTVNSINDLPTISDITNQVMDEDAPITLPLTVNDIETAPGSLTLTATSSNPSVVQNSGITFGGSGANRTVTVTPVTNQSGSATITLTVTDGNGGTVQDVFSVTVRSVNDTPVISTIPAKTITEDTSTGIISFTVTDAETPANSLFVSATSSNPTLVPASQLAITGTSTNRSLNITPTTNQNGTATITISARDAEGLLGTMTFLLTVTPVNDLPQISAVANQATDEDVPISIPFSISDVETPASSLTVSGTSANTTLVPAANLVFSGTGANRSVTITPAANQSGTANITLNVNDGATNASRTFSLTVNSKNDPPTLGPIADQTLSEDPSQQVIVLTGISTGAANETQTLTFTTSSSNPSVVPNPAVNYTNGNSTASLLLNPVANASGVARIVVILSDGQDQVSQAFTVTINPANDAPVISNIAAQTTSEDTPITVSFTVSDAETPAANLVLSATSTNTTLVPVSNIAFNGSGTSQSVTITPAPEQSGTTRITISASDGTNTSSANFVLTVNAVNDPPTLNPLPNLSFAQSPGNQPVSLSGITSGPANESSQSLSVKVISSNTALIPAPTVAYTSPNPTGSFTFRPANNATGTSTITVTVTDNGSPTNSISRSFIVYVRATANANPTIAAIANQSTAEDTPITIPVTIGDDATAAASLVLGAFSTDTTLFPSNSFTFGGSGSSRTVTITPSLNRTGSAPVTVWVTDSASGYTATNFTLTVNSANDLPTISSIAPQTIAENTTLAPVPFTVSDAETPASALTFTATSSNQGLVPNANITIGGNGTNRAVMVRPINEQSGTATITITVNDGAGGSADTAFLLTVNGDNSLPTISDIANQTISEDTATAAIPFTVGDVETPAASLAISATSSNPSLIPNANIAVGGSGGNRTVTITPFPDQFGSAVITLTVTDGGSASANDTFLVTVNPVNDPPALDPIGNITLDAGAGTQTVNLTGISFGPANEAQTLALSAESSNPAVIPQPAVNYSTPASTGTLSFTPVAGTNGSATINVVISDGQSQNGSVTRTFTVTVRDVAPPTIAIRRSGANVILSWPAAGSFTVQSRDDALPAGPWTDVAGTPILVGANYNLTLPATSARKFYRLRN